MPRDDSGMAVEIQTGPSTAPGRLASGTDVPARFAGRVRFALDIEDAVDAFDMALHRAARPDGVTADVVRQHCQARGQHDHRMEWAVLKEACRVVSRELLIERLVTAARRRLTGSAHEEVDSETLEAGDGQSGRGGTLAAAYRGAVTAEGDRLTVRCSLGATIAAPLTIAPPGRPSPVPPPRPDVPVGGTLSVEGAFRPRHRGHPPVDVRVHWRVQAAADAPLVRAWSPLASPLEEIVSYIGTSALSRFGEVLPRHLAALARGERGPAFIQVERLLRLGRVSQKSRIYLLYWQRLRDFLLWRVSTGVC